LADPDGLAGRLRAGGLIEPAEPVVSMTKAGEGNMNCTVRVVTPWRSLIVKQARPWVERYPQFDAPVDRALGEIKFYSLAATAGPVAAGLPRLLHADAPAHLLVLEDLGSAGDYADIYRGATFTTPELKSLAAWLSGLHTQFRGYPARDGFANRDMRALNSRHIFRLPLEADNGLDLDALTPGLAGAAADLRNDHRLVVRLGELVGHYLADGDHLIHGDFFPGSLLRTSRGPKVIDPEFAHFGRPEFDCAVLLAHLRLAGQPASLGQAFLQAYRQPPGFDHTLMRRFAGAEIIRRLIGYAQLPLTIGLVRKAQLLTEARALVLDAD
jgi:5-methylthioribose kinase